MAASRISLVLVLFSAIAVASDWPRLSDAPATAYGHVDHQSDVYIAAEPYDTPAKLETAFPKLKLEDSTFLPVRIIVTNNSGLAADLRRARFELMTSDRTRLQPLGDDEAEGKVLYHARGGRRRSGIGLPIPLPASGSGDVKFDREFQSRLFKTRLIPPHTTESGFLFFQLYDYRVDNSRVGPRSAGATIYISNVLLGEPAKPLFYFEIHFD